MDLIVRIQGTRPLLMHNVRLANPMDPCTRDLAAATKASKAAKTDQAFEAVQHAEFVGGLYIDEDGPYLPTTNITQALRDGGVAFKLGSKVLKAFAPFEMRAQLLYDGPRDIEGLWKGRYYDVRGARVGQALVQRTRPCFVEWSIECAGELDEATMTPEDFERCVLAAGKAGLGDYRPAKGGLFGRFDAKVEQL
jgi:hypothetical protein